MSGIDVEYTGQTVKTITLTDGKVIYNEGDWTDNFESRVMRVGASVRTVDGANAVFDEWLQRGLEEPFNVDEKALIIETLMRTYNGGFYKVDQKPHWIKAQGQGCPNASC